MQMLDLTGDWTLTRLGQGVTYPAVVPGTVHEDLLRAGAIDDPFRRDNELSLQWIGKEAWAFERSFDVPASLLERQRVVLRCEGLDTVALLEVNGQSVGQADNQYRTWEYDLAGVLRAGANTIRVTFRPVDEYIGEAMERARQAGRTLRGWGSAPWEAPLPRGYVRKMPCNFGWDWGPALVTCGIWRPIEIVAFDAARLTDVAITQHHDDGRVALTVNVEAQAVAEDALTARVAVRLAGQEVAEGEVGLSGDSGSLTLDVPDAKLWWPAGMGDQPLYDVEVSLAKPGHEALDARRERIGLRTLRLDRHADAWGETFQFVANGEPFFAKGANWIPVDGIYTRASEADYERLVRAAAEANMNMLRVWGGGLYEQDVFYRLCDELGICVWQDFMYACQPVPLWDEAFVDNALAEAADNIRRLRHHACLALWCGNNEMEMCTAGKGRDGDLTWEEYCRFFDDQLGQLARDLSPQTDYWPSSPHNPHGDRHHFNDPTCGDAHLWAVWHGREPFEWYRTCEHRFNSEFGFQSFPELRTVETYTDPGDRNVTSPVMEHHQRSRTGNANIMHYMLDWFRMPSGFESTLRASQILQANAIRYAVEHWRRSMPRGMGTLYWQINDNWPVASWASIDYHGRWKALHYLARRFFAPVMLSGLEDAEARTVELHVTSDLRESAELTCRWTLQTPAGQTVDVGEQVVQAAGRADTLATTVDLAPHADAHGPGNVILFAELLEGGRRLSETFSVLVKPKALSLEEPQIERRVTPAGDGDGAGAYDVALTARRPALWTWLDLAGADATYSDSYLSLPAGAERTVRVTPAVPFEREDFSRRLRVGSLIDTYLEE
jgi:beta-mannosidase